MGRFGQVRARYDWNRLTGVRSDGTRQPQRASLDVWQGRECAGACPVPSNNRVMGRRGAVARVALSARAPEARGHNDAQVPRKQLEALGPYLDQGQVEIRAFRAWRGEGIRPELREARAGYRCA